MIAERVRVARGPIEVVLGLHLWHGASSWFQSLGLNRRGYDRFVHRVGPVIAAVVILGNCSIPLAILVSVITLSLLARLRSRHEESFGAKVIAALRREFGGHAVQTK